MSKPCNRCGATDDAMQVCWYCVGDLCSECWEALGHCGHPEAERINEAGRAASSWEERDALIKKELPS